ncbi:MAG: CRISPR-associated protein Cas4 [Fimbriimonadaceae bacterium]|nr:CRISPR-associated protein Cas4 [Fimbriimonadaceae bacterium]RIJ98972.1 MAG: CRISPR-associated protein Cas4 [Armatimonadota bacterium]
MASSAHAYQPRDTVSVSELRQWMYCPRVVWYGRSMGDYRPTTGAMKVGIEAEAERQRLEERRSFAQYGLEACNKRFQVPVASEALGLSGRIDCLIELTPVSLEDAQVGVRPLNWKVGDPMFVPVEYKWTSRADQRQNTIQLAAYGMILESLTGTPVPLGFIALLPEEEVVRVELVPRVRRAVKCTLDEAREGLSAPELPWPTLHRGKCQDCEFRRFCNDVW